MLKREIESISRMVSDQYSRIWQDIETERKTKREKVVDDFIAEPRVQVAIDTLATITGSLKPSIEAGLRGNGIGGFSWSPKAPLRVELTALVAPFEERTVHYGASPLYGIVNVALNTTNKKWSAIQPGIYAFADEAPRAKTFSELEDVVKKMLALF